MAVTRPLSGRQAATMAYKIDAPGLSPAHPPIRRPPMTERHGWKPVSLADDDEDGDNGDEDEGEDDDE